MKSSIPLIGAALCCLPNPEAGSDVGAITTTAVKNSDGTYSISGNKIFITNGEHDLTENIIHPVLARIEGDPAGNQRNLDFSWSPKYGSMKTAAWGNPNDVVCTGIEEKMGIHASPTCSMTLGGKGNCRGLLLGEACQGMKIMFYMMNEARLGVGFQAFAYASAAYLYALELCPRADSGPGPGSRQRSGVRRSVPIIQHPDVRRMLLEMKAYVDGMRSFVHYVGQCLEKESPGQPLMRNGHITRDSAIC